MDWPTVTVDALDLHRAARQLADELGPERARDLAETVRFFG